MNIRMSALAERVALQLSAATQHTKSKRLPFELVAAIGSYLCESRPRVILSDGGARCKACSPNSWWYRNMAFNKALDISRHSIIDMIEQDDCVNALLHAPSLSKPITITHPPVNDEPAIFWTLVHHHGLLYYGFVGFWDLKIHRLDPWTKESELIFTTDTQAHVFDVFEMGTDHYLIIYNSRHDAVNEFIVVDKQGSLCEATKFEAPFEADNLVSVTFLTDDTIFVETQTELPPEEKTVPVDVSCCSGQLLLLSLDAKTHRMNLLSTLNYERSEGDYLVHPEVSPCGHVIFLRRPPTQLGPSGIITIVY